MCALPWLLPSLAQAGEEACPPAMFQASEHVLPRAWQDELDALLVSIAGRGQPWDCSGARLSLDLTDEGAVLTVTLRDGRVVVRPVPSPDLLKPTGQAVLTAIDAPEAPPPPPPSSRAAASPTPPAEVATLPPRVLLDAMFVSRFVVPPRSAWAGGGARVTVPFGAWSAAAWARFDAPVGFFESTPDRYRTTEVCIGIAGGHAFVSRPFELRVSLGPSMALFHQEAGVDPVTTGVEGSLTDFRVGSDLALAWPFARKGRFVLGSDFELSPQNFSGERRARSSLPALPAFSVGLSAGIGVSLR